ncbi:hypothetical protein [Chitinophaga sp. YIM B06452]|uniref:hypothetical protein n=1 Tax=Chitinophaga sp. YIM B06452 TaxID=3082158 RepID=UPI0031FEC642
MALIADCQTLEPALLAACLVNPGSGAEPGGVAGGQAVSACLSYDRDTMIECLTGGADLECCFVAGIGGCVLLFDGEPVTIS